MSIKTESEVGEKGIIPEKTMLGLFKQGQKILEMKDGDGTCFTTISTSQTSSSYPTKKQQFFCGNATGFIRGDYTEGYRAELKN